MFKKLPENVKFILSAVLPTFAIVILALIVANIGLGRISDMRRQISTSQRNVATLTEKISVLTTVQNVVADNASVVAIALPDSNPSLAVLNQLKSLAATNSVVLASIKSGAEIQDASGLSRSDITFEVQGGKGEVVNFIKSISTIAPISVVDQIRLNQTNATTRASLTVKTYWSSLPTQLPAVTQAVSQLSQEEIQQIGELQGLIRPQFSILTPEAGGGKPDPFTQAGPVIPTP
jgi:Tfp pilus assembly protein PilO